MYMVSLHWLTLALMLQEKYVCREEKLVESSEYLSSQKKKRTNMLPGICCGHSSPFQLNAFSKIYCCNKSYPVTVMGNVCLMFLYKSHHQI